MTVTYPFGYYERLLFWGIMTLETWRLQDDFIEVFKILVGLKDVYVTVLMRLQSGLHGHPYM